MSMAPHTWDNVGVSKWSIAAAWVLVAAVATTLTWQIVSAADAQVSDRKPLQVAAPLVGSSDPTTSSTLAPAATASSEPDPTVDTSPGASGSTAPGTSSASAPPTTEGAWVSQTIPTGGGVVVIRYRAGEVVLGSASPAAGFAAEIKKEGPPEVDVEFESESADYRVRVAWLNGALSVDTETEVGED